MAEYPDLTPDPVAEALAELAVAVDEAARSIGPFGPRRRLREAERRLRAALEVE